MPKAGSPQGGGAHRFYRSRHQARGWTTFEVKLRQTDLWIRAERDLTREALDAVASLRHQLEKYISQYPRFLTSLAPLPDDPFAPLLIRRMLQASLLAGVGPMAAVAGAVAEGVGQALKPFSSSTIVENGGDCYLDVHEEIRMGVYAGPDSPFRDRIILRFPPKRFPLAICTSSGTIGHSLSFGKSDAVAVVSKDGALADAAATALGNLVQTPSHISEALERGAQIPGVEGILILAGERMGVWGNMEIVPPEASERERRGKKS